MSTYPAPTDDRWLAEQRRLRRQLMVLVGVVLTLLGLFLIGATFPVDTSGLVRVLPLAGGGVLAVWLGGILLGRGSRERRRPDEVRR